MKITLKDNTSINFLEGQTQFIEVYVCFNYSNGSVSIFPLYQDDKTDRLEGDILHNNSVIKLPTNIQIEASEGWFDVNTLTHCTELVKAKLEEVLGNDFVIEY